MQYHRSALRLFEAAGDEQKAYIHLRKILALAEYHTEVLENLDRIFAEKQLSGVYRWLAYEHPEERDIGFYLPPLSYARFAIAAGEYDDAFAWLNQAYEQRQGYLVWLAVDPKYKPLHQDPRWGELLEKVGLRVQHQWAGLCFSGSAISFCPRYLNASTKAEKAGDAWRRLG